jgi:hypothetical protein
MKPTSENTTAADSLPKNQIQEMSWEDIKANLGPKMTGREVLQQLKSRAADAVKKP